MHVEANWILTGESAMVFPHLPEVVHGFVEASALSILHVFAMLD